jgi:hypothetical protein
MKRGWKLGKAAQFATVDLVVFAQACWLRRERGRLPEWVQLDLASVAGSLGALGNAPAQRVSSCVALNADLVDGNLGSVRTRFEALAERDFRDIPRDEHWLIMMAVLAEAATALGDCRRAARIYDLLLPYESLNAFEHLLRTDGGSIGHFLGQLAATRGDLDAAVLHFESAMEMNARMGARPHLARSQAECGGALRARSGPGDSERARELIARAQATADDLGMKPLARRLAELGI